MPLAEGQTICRDKYRVLRLIGEGAFARVWLAEEPEFGRRLVAIKELKREELSTAEIREQERRFGREVELAAQLDTARAPSVVKAITLEKWRRQRLLVMEYVDGGSLADLIAAHPAGLSIDRAVSITLQICAGLAAFHRLPGVPVHRDIKPSNILLSKSGEAMLSDFGLAQTGESRRSGFMAEGHPGTLGYRSPEQEQSTGFLSPPSDVYALGCVLFEMLSGKLYRDQRPGTPVSALRHDVPQWLNLVLATALQEDPWHRYQTAGEMATALRAEGEVEPEQEKEPAGVEIPLELMKPALVTVPKRGVRQHRILPKKQEDLVKAVYVRDNARVEGLIHSPTVLVVGDGATLMGSVYAAERIQIGSRCQLQDVVSSGPIQIGSESRASGCIVSNSDQPLVAQDLCRALGILSKGDVIIGNEARLNFVLATGDVRLGSDCEVKRIVGRNIEVGARSVIGHATARGNLSLGAEANLDWCSVGGRLVVGPSVKMRDMVTISSHGASLAQAFPLSLGDKLVGQDNAFMVQEERLVPYDEMTEGPESLVVITSLLDRALLKAIEDVASVKGLDMSGSMQLGTK